MQDENLLEIKIPEKFKDKESGEVKLEMLIKSYQELEKKMSNAPSVPKSSDDYRIDCSHGLFQSDDDINKRLHEKGFTQDQAQEVYNLASEKMVPMVNEISADFQAEREIEKLINHFGGAAQWQSISKQLLSFGSKNLPDDVLDSLTSSFEGVMALERMMKNDEPTLHRKGVKSQNGIDSNELSSMMRDPRYWKQKDPAFVAKVTQGFQGIYGK